MLKNRITLLALLWGCSSACYAGDAIHKIPWFGGGGGFQTTPFYKGLVLEVTGIRMVKRNEKSPPIDSWHESTLTCGTFLMDVCVQKYWSLEYANLRACLGGGGWLSFHQVYYTTKVHDEGEKHKEVSFHNPTIPKGVGVAVGGGIGYLLFPRVLLDCFIAWRFPLPLFLGNHVKYPSLGMKLGLVYRFGQQQ